MNLFIKSCVGILLGALLSLVFVVPAQARICESVLADSQKQLIRQRLLEKTSLTEEQANTVIEVYNRSLSRQYDHEGKTLAEGDDWALHREQGFFRKYNKVTVLHSKSLNRSVILLGDRIVGFANVDKDVTDEVVEMVTKRAAQDFVPFKAKRNVWAPLRVLKFFHANSMTLRPIAQNLRARKKEPDSENDFNLHNLDAPNNREGEELLSRVGKFSFIGTSIGHVAAGAIWAYDTINYDGLLYWSWDPLFNPTTIIAGGLYVAASVVLKTLPRMLSENIGFLGAYKRFVDDAIQSNPKMSTDTFLKKVYRWLNSFLADFTQLRNLKELFPNSYQLENDQIAEEVHRYLSKDVVPRPISNENEVVLAVVHNNGSPFRPATWNAVVELLTKSARYDFEEVSLDSQ